jgi:hypothetical protein
MEPGKACRTEGAKRNLLGGNALIDKPKAEEPGAPERYVGNEAELDGSGRKVIDHDGPEIGVFRIKGRFFAYENHCARQGGPVCRGRISKG